MNAQRRLKPFVNPRFSQSRLRIGRSRIHRFGLFAAEKVPRGRKVIEYIGLRISRRSILRRMQKMSRRERSKLVYIAWLNRDWVLDGAEGGSGAEFINHSCDPNLAVRRIRGHLLFFSRRTIRIGEELTADYRFQKRAKGIPCHCGSPKCRGTINLS